MKHYFALAFNIDLGDQSSPVIKKWLVRERNEIKASQALFCYQTEGQESEFCSPLTGVFKAFLLKEDEALQPGSLVAVLEVSEEEQKKGIAAPWGQAITPDEANRGMNYVEAASIRMPG